MNRLERGHSCPIGAKRKIVCREFEIKDSVSKFMTMILNLFDKRLKFLATFAKTFAV
jgi:hypothetical protein